MDSRLLVIAGSVTVNGKMGTIRLFLRPLVRVTIMEGRRDSVL